MQYAVMQAGMNMITLTIHYEMLKKFEELIEEYNSRSTSLDEIFKKLLKLTEELDEEEDEGKSTQKIIDSKKAYSFCQTY